MENQTSTQDPVNQTPVNQTPINPEPVSPMQEVPVVNPELPQRPEIEITPEPEVSPTNNYQQVLNQYATNTVQTPIVETPIRSSEEQLQDLGVSVPPKTRGGFFKVIFSIALILFILVLTALGLVYFKSQKTENNPDSSSFDTVKTSPTPISGNCLLNDKTYQIGDSFPAADGCNTCTCESQDVIACTEKACATPTVATKSASVTPTKKVTPTPTSSLKTTITATPSAAKN